MNITAISLAVAFLSSSGFAQTPAPSPQQDGIVLDRGWATPIQGGSATMEDLGVLLSPFAKAAINTAPAPGLKIYEGVTYLMPYEEARKALNLTQKVISKNKVVCPGFPRDSFFHYAFDGNFEGHFNKLYIVTDKADQVVAIQLVSESPKTDPNAAPYKATDWHTYNFVNSRTKATKRLWIEHKQFYQNRSSWREYSSTFPILIANDFSLVRIDSLLFNPDLDDYGNRGARWKALEAVRLYLPKPMMELILQCIQKGGH